jgi:hypothetical protein
MKVLNTVLALLFPLVTMAMPIKSQMLKPRAYFVEADNNLLEPLDLKSKTLTFGKPEFDQCGLNLARQSQTFSYSCVFKIPSTAKVSRLQNLVTPAKIEVVFGGSKRVVQVTIAPDAHTLTATTEFDHTGIDFEVIKFNDDILKINAKVAQLVLSEALGKQAVRFEVLESR